MKTTQNLMRVKELLLTPPTFSDNKARLQTNLDTDFLKLIAIVSMLIDHIGSVFFPEVRVLRWIGRLAFPIFCYCMTVGLLYTHDIKKYLFRLGIFALISQPCYIFAFHPYDFWSQFTNWNIFFTLFLSLLAMYGWMERTQMVAVRTDLFCDFMVELRLLQQRNFFDAGVLSLPQQSGSRGHVLSAVYSSASAFRPPR